MAWWEWHRKDITDTWFECREQRKGHLQLGFSPPPSLQQHNTEDCTQTHTRRMCFKAHTQRHGQVFSKPNCQRSGFHVLNMDSRLLSDHRKWKVPWEQDRPRPKIPYKQHIPGLLCREGLNGRRALMRSCSPITTSVVFLGEIGGLASECSKGRQGLEMEKRLRPLAENCFPPLLFPKVKTRK